VAGYSIPVVVERPKSVRHAWHRSWFVKMFYWRTRCEVWFKEWFRIYHSSLRSVLFCMPHSEHTGYGKIQPTGAIDRRCGGQRIAGVISPEAERSLKVWGRASQARPPGGSPSEVGGFGLHSWPCVQSNCILLPPIILHTAK